MHLVNQRAVGIVILFLLGILVIIKQRATGSVVDKPKGNFLILLTNLFNLFFLLLLNPLAALLLMTGHLEAVDPTHLAIDAPWLLMAAEAGGMVLYVIGYLLMAWALMRLGSNYQLGGIAPRDSDKMVVVGPYRLVRHPMYTATLCISFGLVCLIQSLAYLVVLCIYLVLISLLIPIEEKELQRVYGEQYITYRRKGKKLIPCLY